MVFRGSVFVVILMLLFGCSIVDERKEAYKDAELLPPLEVPPDLLSIDASDDLSAGIAPMGASVTLSEFDKAAETVETKAKKEPVTDSQNRVMPQAGASIGFTLDPSKVSLSRDGNSYWLTAPGTPEYWWGEMINFLQSQEIALEKRVPALGLIFTGWHENKKNLPESSFFSKAFSLLRSSHLRDQFVVRIEKTVEGTGSEIHIVHRGMRHVEYGENLHWLPRERDVELEIEMLKRFALFVNVGESEAHALFDETEEVVETFSLQNEGEESVWIKLVMGYAQAWREIGNELTASGYEIEDLNRSQGIYIVHGNLLSEIDKVNVFSAFTGEGKGQEKTFVVKLQDQGGYVSVIVEEHAGVALSLEEKNNFLAELLDELD